jgi:hypothetical protein
MQKVEREEKGRRMRRKRGCRRWGSGREEGEQ